MRRAGASATVAGPTILEALVVCWVAACAASTLPAAEVPGTVAELWADFDPRHDPLEVEVIREWTEAAGTFRHVRYLVGTFKGTPARMTAIYGFPTAVSEKVPAVMHIHGGGQRGSLAEVKLLVARGYAGLSVNWGGRGTATGPFNAVEGAQPDEPNTDWGAVDPSQRNVQGYTTLQPGPLQYHEDREHPQNNNWYLLALGCRRGLTFLERQPEVDAARLGVHGYSMGGNLTMYVAGTDDRVKVAVPAVGGQGWRWEPHVFTGGTAPPQDRIQGDIDLFRRTLSFESYAPRIRCPLLHRGATNDFHGWMDDVHRTDALIPGRPVLHSWTPHTNHRLSPETEVALPLWLDQHLKGGPPLPDAPVATLQLPAGRREATLRVHADTRWPIERCEVYYSVDADPRARFWRSADITRDDESFVATLPLFAHGTPLFAFANVHHALPQPVSLAELPGHAEPVRQLCLSSGLESLPDAAITAESVSLRPAPGPVIDDFAHGWRDWYRLNAGNRVHWQHWTRKITDPAWRGPDGTRLVLTLRVPQANRITVVLVENEWRSYRGRRRTFTCTRPLVGGTEPESLSFTPADFVPVDKSLGGLASWSQIDVLGLCGHHPDERPVRPAEWQGPLPEFVRLEWRPAE